jgi:gluconate 2-dehydrogenase gamma chain
MRVRTRRTFLGAAAAATLTGAAGCGGASGAWRFFTDREARTLEAMLERLIPEDDAPGARQAGVIHYIDRQLKTRFAEHRKTYRDGIAAAERMAGGCLADASLELREKVIHELEHSGATQPFFELVLAHAMQGFYGNPRHGGNREFVSWRMLGVSPLQVRGRAKYDLTKGAADAKG